MDAHPRSRWIPSYVAILLASGWLAAIALLKLFAGNPMDLPKVVLEASPFDPETTFPLAIAIELVVALVALCRPRVGWIPLVGLYLVFEAVLAALIASGAKSCGCAGGAISIHPIVMSAIDGALLIGVLAGRPWRLQGGPWVGVPVLAVGLVVLAVAPFPIVSFRMRGNTTAPPSFVVLHPDRWVQQLIFDVPELKDHLEPGDLEKLPTDGLVLVWRQTCEHCRDHLRELVNDKVRNDGTKPIALVQIKDDLDKTAIVDVFPEGPHVTRLGFKVGPQYALQTPWEIHVEGGMVLRALDGEHAKAAAAGGGH
jgi:hypothetical protein